MNRVVVVGGGVSGLATAFRIQQRFALRHLPLEILLLEAQDRLGGKIRSERRDGYLFEWGPNGFLDGKPDTLALCSDLGIRGELLPSSDAARKRYVLSGGKLHRVPESPVQFFRSSLLSVGGRLRILREPWVRATPPGVDTSIAEFGARRLGKEAADKLLDPMVSGILAGDPALLSLEACFPRIAELERDHGSLIRALVALQKQRRRESVASRQAGAETDAQEEKTASKAGPAGPAGILVSFREGAERLVTAMKERLGGSVQTGCVVESVTPDPGASAKVGYRVRVEERGVQRELACDAVVVAVPAYRAARILGSMDGGLSVLLQGIPYAALVVVGLGFREGETPGPLDGFGFLVPFAERTAVLGSLWTTRIFEFRSPSGYVLTRNMVGGWRNSWVVSAEEEELEKMALGVLERATGVRGKVAFRYAVRHEQAIPSYLIGHGRRLEQIRGLLGRFPGVYLTGNAYRGVAINDCTREAVRVAEEVEGDFLAGRWGERSAG